LYVVAFVVFILAVFALYLTLRSEQKQYDEIENVMEGKQAAEDAEGRGLLWNGNVDGYEVQIRRGMRLRDSHRLITILVGLTAPYHLRIDPNNPLRQISRAMGEILTESSKMKQEGSLKHLLVYCDQPDMALDLVGRLNNQEAVETLRQFHHVEINPLHLSAWFYQPDISLEEIKDRTDELVELLEKTDADALLEENEIQLPERR